MESVAAGIVGMVLLVPLVGLNLVLSMGKTFSKKVAGLVGSLVKEEAVLSPEEERRFKRLERLFLLVWVLAGGGAGIYFIIAADPTGVAGVIGVIGGAVGLFTAFKSGALLTRFVAYAFHDRRLITEKAGEIPLGSLVSKAVLPGIAANALFLLVWVLLFRMAKVGVAVGEGGANWLPLGLWLGGLVFGYVYGMWRAHEDPRFLMRDDLGVVAFMGVMKADRERQKVDRNIASLRERIRRGPR